MNDRYNNLNDVDIRSISISSDQGGNHEIMGQVKHISIFEDITNSCMEGHALVVDGYSLINHFPIVGQETLKISFKTPGFGKNYQELEFEIYSIEGRHKSDNGKSEGYEIKFISKEFRMSKIKRISKAYKGKISSMVGEIFAEHFPKSNVLIFETISEHKFVIPNISPIETIEWLSNRSISEQGGYSNYIFFQRMDGFYYIPIAKLNRAEAKYSYEMLPTGVNNDNVIGQYYNIQEMSTVNQFDRLSELYDGMYSSNLIVHDITNKNYSVTVRRYINNFGKGRLEEYPYLPVRNRYSSSPIAVSNLVTRQSSMHDEVENNQNYEEWLLDRNARLKEMDTNRIKVTLAGNSDLHAGDVLNIRTPSSEPKRSSDSDWKDKYLSGRYLVNSVRHYINIIGNREYKCIVELSRDSVPVRVPDKSTFLGTGKDDGNQNNEYFERN